MKQEKSKKVSKLEQLDEHDLLISLLAEKTKAIDPNKVFWVGETKSGQVGYKLAGKSLTPQQAANLHTEAQVIAKMGLWKIMTETLRHTAHLKMFSKAENFDDMKWGKAMLYNIDVMETIVSKLESMEMKPPPMMSQSTREQVKPIGMA